MQIDVALNCFSTSEEVNPSLDLAFISFTCIKPLGYHTAAPTILQALGVAVCILRIVVQRWKGTWGWDDGICAVAVTMSVVAWSIHVALVVQTAALSKSVPLSLFGQTTSLISGTMAVWASRASLSITIFKILGDGLFKTIAHRFSLFFVLSGLVLGTYKVVFCGINFNGVPFCTVHKNLGYIELSLYILGDTWLIVGALYMVHRLSQISEAHRRMLSVIFSCGILPAAAGILHAVYSLKQKVLPLLILGQLEMALCIINCNLVILVPFFYKRLASSAPLSTTRPASTHPVELSKRTTNDRNGGGMSIMSKSFYSLTVLGSSMLGGVDTTSSSRASPENGHLDQ